jgi:hypothetical protein
MRHVLNAQTLASGLVMAGWGCGCGSRSIGRLDPRQRPQLCDATDFRGHIAVNHGIFSASHVNLALSIAQDIYLRV